MILYTRVILIQSSRKSSGLKVYSALLLPIKALLAWKSIYLRIKLLAIVFQTSLSPEFDVKANNTLFLLLLNVKHRMCYPHSVGEKPGSIVSNQKPVNAQRSFNHNEYLRFTFINSKPHQHTSRGINSQGKDQSKYGKWTID